MPLQADAPVHSNDSLKSGLLNRYVEFDTARLSSAPKLLALGDLVATI